MLYSRRGKFSEQNKKLGAFFSRFGLSPNQWTLLAIIFALLAFVSLANSNFLLGALFFAIASFLDVVDGAVARAAGKSTKTGAYIDTIADRYAEFVVIAALVFVEMPTPALPFVFWLFLYLFGSGMTTYAKSAAKEKELAREEIAGGILERGERLILLFIGIALGHFDRLYLSYIIVILAVLSNITAFQRIHIAIRSRS